MLRRLGWCGAALLAVAALVVPADPAAAAPVGYVAYVSGGQIHIGTVDLGAGSPTITEVGNTHLSSATHSPQALAIHPQGHLGLLTRSTSASASVLVSLDPTNGQPRGQVTLDIDATDAGLAYSSDGITYVTNGNQVRAVDMGSGATIVVATIGGSTLTGLAAQCVDAGGSNALFAISPFDRQVYRFDRDTGTVTRLTETLRVFVSSPKLGFDDSGTLWALNVALGTPNTFIIDTVSGTGAPVGEGEPLDAAGLAIGPPRCPLGTVVPAPPSPAGPNPAGTPPAAVPVAVTPRFTG